MTPTVSFSVGSGWLQPDYAPETSAFARPGPALLSFCDGCCLLHLLLLLHRRCSYPLPALHDGRAASVVQLVITVQVQTAEVQVVSPGASVKAVIGEPERAVHSLTGEAGGRGCFPGAVELGHGIAAGRPGVELGAVDDEDDDGGGGDGGGVVAVVGEVPDGAVTSSPSCGPWMSQGC